MRSISNNTRVVCERRVSLQRDVSLESLPLKEGYPNTVTWTTTSHSQTQICIGLNLISWTENGLDERWLCLKVRPNELNWDVHLAEEGKQWEEERTGTGTDVCHWFLDFIFCAVLRDDSGAGVRRRGSAPLREHTERWFLLRWQVHSPSLYINTLHHFTLTLAHLTDICLVKSCIWTHAIMLYICLVW